jgi:hypothetical protein
MIVKEVETCFEKSEGIRIENEREQSKKAVIGKCPISILQDTL